MPKEPGYRLIRSKKRKKTIALRIQRNGVITIRAPYHTPSRDIDRFYEDKKQWLSKKLSSKGISPGTPKKFITGETFLFLGTSYELDIRDPNGGKATLDFSNNRFVLSGNHNDRVKELFIRWYKKEALKKITERVDFYSRRLDLFPEGVKITNAEYRWGSCSAGNVLCFSWRLAMIPPAVVDYVVVHELLHMKEKNHSPKFWHFVETAMPRFQEQKQWLKNNSYGLFL
ncbi:hypothetical protein BMS3Abin10_00574 [bacterium BMS3Abin10]|nr:hypothetical protein BMS3Abin10_00574 [bacterium BMS3Abin10]GBE39778.1 hypothetical protein BMS3Bbin08_02409 [bacterium BMS3Bbin08]